MEGSPRNLKWGLEIGALPEAISVQVTGPSPWMNELYKKILPAHRKQIQARAAAQKKQMTIKTIKKDTLKAQVPPPQSNAVRETSYEPALRTGGRDLRESGSYPPDFGRRAASS